MLLDCADLELLRLVGVYRLLPPGELRRYGFAASYEVSAELLLSRGLLEWCGPKRAPVYLRLSESGVQFLARHGINYPRYCGRSLKQEETRRLFETLRIALLCRRAGIDSTQDNLDILTKQPSFVAAEKLREKGVRNVISSIQSVGFGHWADTAYMFYYVSPLSFGPHYRHEIQVFRNLQPLFHAERGATMALISAGESYEECYRCMSTPPVEEKKRNGQIAYAKAYQMTKLPLHLTACNDTGAAQLALMAQPGCRERVAKLLLGSRWSPPPADLPGADGMDGGTPLSVAADLNLKRLADLCRRAWGKGYPTVAVAALKEQVDGVLARALPIEGIKLLYFEAGDLQNAFDAPLLFTPEHTGAVSPTGEAMVL